MRQTRHELTPLVAAAQGLVAPQVVRSLPFRRVATGALDFEGVAVELLEFKLAFERALWAAGVPVYATKLRSREVQFMHFPRYRDLNRHEWKVVNGLGAMIALQGDWPVSVEPGDPSWWVLACDDDFA